MSFEGLISDVLKAVSKGAKETDFHSYVGDTNYDRAEYPMAQVFPENTTYQGDLEYEDSMEVFFFFEKGNTKDNSARESEFLSNVEQVEAALDKIMEELDSEERVKEFKPVDFNFLIAENSENLLDGIQVTFGITKLQEFC